MCLYKLALWRPLPNMAVRFLKKKKKSGLVRDSNPGPLAPEARIIPLDQQASQCIGGH